MAEVQAQPEAPAPAAAPAVPPAAVVGPKSGNVNVITGDGELQNFPPDQLQDAISDGGRLATPQEVQAAQFQEAHSGALPAAGLGALSGATLGLGNELINKLGLTTPEAQAAYKTAHPWLFGGAQMVGSIAPIAGLEALTGGAATPAIAGAETAAEVAPVAGDLTAAATKAAAATVSDASEAGMAARTAQALPPPGAGTLGHLAKDFGIGAGLSAGNQVTEDALGDNHALDAEVMVPAMLAGGATAAVAGLGLRSAVKALTPALQRTQGALGGFSDALGDFLGQRAIKSGVKAGLDEGSIGMALSDPEAALNPQTLAAEKAQQLSRDQNLGKGFYAATKELLDGAKEQSQDFHANVRPQDAINLMANHDLPTVQDSAMSMLQDQQAKIDQFRGVRQISTGRLDVAQDLIDKAAGKVADAQQPGDVFNVLNDYKRAQGDLVGFERNPAAGTDVKVTQNAMKDLNGAALRHLEDQSVYGEAASVQAQINPLETRSINLRKNLMADMGRVVTQGGAKVRVLDEDKFKTLLNAVQDGRRSAQFQNLTDWADSVKDLNDAYAERAAQVPTKQMALNQGDVQNLLDAANQAREQGLTTAGQVARNAPVGPATAYQAIGGKLGQPALYDRGVQDLARTGLMAGGLHMLGVPSPVVGGIVLAKAALGGGEMLPAASTVKVLAMIAKAKNAFGSAADGAIGSMLKGGARHAGSVLPIIAEHLSRGPQDFQLGDKSHAGLSDRESFQQHAADIRAATSSPDALQPGKNDLLAAAPTIGSQALAAHQRALGVLGSALPSGSESDTDQQARLFAAPSVASPLERQQWINTANLIHEPLSVIPLMQAGMLTKKSIATLKQAYPATYAELSRKLMNELADMDPKARAKLAPGLVDSMSTFLGVPLSGLQNMKTIALSQQTMAASPGQNPSPGAQMPKRIRRTAKMGYATRAETPNQAADQILAGR